MIDAPQCVICDGRIRRLQRALVAPFLARRIWDRPPFCVDLVRCSACGFTFYNPRLDAAEEGRLYANYRSEEYRRMRQSSEPWYTAKFNAGLAAADYFERRRRVLGGMLRQHIGNRVIRRVLDYGGDHGDLVCGLVDGAAAFVYDISGVPAAAGVTATTDPVGSQADLIVNSHVLEHVGFPRRLLEDILKASPAGGLVFLEVPCESPFGLSRIARRIAQIGVVALMRPALALSVVRPASLFMMHEHVNYFTERSLAALMRSRECAVIAAGNYALESSLGKVDTAWCLGTAP
ncbi:MAG: class I SAM-dependent methyltransferase [Bryobacteraceae bacterium]